MPQPTKKPNEAKSTVSDGNASNTTGNGKSFRFKTAAQKPANFSSCSSDTGNFSCEYAQAFEKTLAHALRSLEKPLQSVPDAARKGRSTVAHHAGSSSVTRRLKRRLIGIIENEKYRPRLVTGRYNTWVYLTGAAENSGKSVLVTPSVWRWVS